MKKLAVGAAFMMILTAAPAHAVIFQYYEGNDCTQNRLGAADTETLKGQGRNSLSWNLKGAAPNVTLIIKVFAPMTAFSHPDTYNDEIRSVRIFSNWRTVQESRNPTFTVYDDPDGKKNDDWAKIYVSDAALIPDEGVCVGSFERSFNKYGIRLERHPVNGLDGKISRLAIGCDEACRTNLTPDPNPPVPEPETPRAKPPLTPLGPARKLPKGTTTRPLGSKSGVTKKVGPAAPKVVPRRLR